MTEEIHQTLNEAGQLDAVALDMSKAFDRVPHAILLSKLKRLQDPNYIVMLLKGYLSGRGQRFIVDGSASDISAVVPGVPKGSILVFSLTTACFTEGSTPVTTWGFCRKI